MLWGRGGRVPIKLRPESRKKDVAAFLGELKTILQDRNFDCGRDLIMIRTKKQGRERYSTPYTLLDLGYGARDVAERLKELTVEEYSETLWDRDNPDPPLLFVFGKTLQGRQVYIKLKIKGKRRVLCVSFHYAEAAMSFPYAQ